MKSGRPVTSRERLTGRALKKRWKKIAAFLACVVVLCSTYSLILPAITMSSQQANCSFEEHEHSEECCDAEGNLICGLEEHLHTLACYADLNADIENEEQWQSEIPDLTEDRNANVVNIAASLVGYQESSSNYLVSDEEQTQGYTRFGHWYGETVNRILTESVDEIEAEIREELYAQQEEILTADPEAELPPVDEIDIKTEYAEEIAARIPEKIADKKIGILPSDIAGGCVGRISNGLPSYAYMDWNAMFVSYVLYYADVPEFGAETDAGSWAGSLEAAGYYTDDPDYIPSAGDLVFFIPSAGADVQVGIVSHVNKNLLGLGKKVKSLDVILGDEENTVSVIRVAVGEYSEGEVVFDTISGYAVHTPREEEPGTDSSVVDSVVGFFQGVISPEAPADEAVADEAAEETAGDEADFEEVDAAADGTVSEDADQTGKVPDISGAEDESFSGNIDSGDAADISGEGPVDASVADELSGSDGEEEVESETADGPETVSEPAKSAARVEIADSGLSEDGTAMVLQWKIAARLPEDILPAGAVIRVNTAAGKNHMMTPAQARKWAGEAKICGGTVSFAEDDNYEITFIGGNGDLYTWEDVRQMKEDAGTAFTGIQVKVLAAAGQSDESNDDSSSADDEGSTVEFVYPTEALIADAKIGRNHYITKVSIDGLTGTGTFTYDNSEAVRVDQDRIREDADTASAGTADTDKTGKGAEKTSTLTASGSDYTVTMTYGADAGIPEIAKLKVSEIRSGSKDYKDYMSEAKGAIGIGDDPRADVQGRFFDIKIVTKEGEITPKVPVRVDIRYKKAIKDVEEEDLTAVHFAKDGAETVRTEPEMAKGAIESVGFEAESFSVYGIIYVVDFHWEMDGKSYEFSLPGGGYVSFTDLVKVLGISAPDADRETGEEKADESGNADEAAASEVVRRFVADVENIRFSTPALLSVSKAEADTTVGAVKDSLGLECRYSADLTEEQIAVINETKIAAGDWALISLMPFDTDECLTVTMKTGEVFTIRITDAATQVPDSLQSDLLAYIPFDDYSFQDTSGNNAKVTYDSDGYDFAGGNAYWPIRNGEYGNCFKIETNNTTPNYSLSVTDSTGGSLIGDRDEVTISFWAKPTDTNNSNWPFYAADDNTQRGNNHLNYIGLFNRDGNVTNERFADTRANTTTGSAALNEWHHYTVTHSADTVRLYIDGVLADEETGLGKTLQDVLGDDSIFQIGRANWGVNGEYYKGYIDEFAVFGKALTENEVSELYSAYERDAFGKDSHSAVKTGVKELQDGDRVVIYDHVWNPAKNDYDDYAIDGDGNLVKISNSGDSVYWRGDPSLEWILTAHEDENRRYYELYNPVTGNYLYPQSNNQLFTDQERGINLPARMEEEKEVYGSAIRSWDNTEMAYYGYRYEDGQLQSVCAENFGEVQDEEFYFAVAETPTDALRQVETVENPEGLVMRMFDYNKGNTTDHRQRLSYMTSVLSHWQYQPGPTQGILENYFDPESANPFPDATATNYDLSWLFTPDSAGYRVGGEVDHLFIKSTYDETGYYEYSAFENYAQLNGTSGDFTVYQQIGTPRAQGDRIDNESFYFKRGNFTPYNKIQAGRLSNQHNMYDEDGHDISPSDPRYGENLYLPTTPIDYYFGMSMDANFEMPKDGLDTRGNPVTFMFNGDDDMWVYIDGVLVMDLGGVHDAREAIINFTDGTITYAYPGENTHPTTIKECFRLAGHLPNGDPWDDARVDEFFKGNTLKDFSQHKLNMYYMERGEGASNLHMRFNLQMVTPGSFTVEKALDGANDKYANREFAFRAYNAADDSVINPKTDSTITCKYEGTNRDVKMDADGTFYLKPGEKAVFKVGSQSMEYYVKELGLTDEFDVSINDEPTAVQDGSAQSTTDHVGSRGSLEFSNHENRPGSLEITKTVLDAETDETFEFYIYMEKTSGEMVPYGMAPYKVKNKENGLYYKYVGTTLEPADDQSNPPTYTTGPYGTAGNIPHGFTIEITDLLPGTHFLVVERRDNMPDGFQYAGKTMTAETYDPTTTIETYNGVKPDGRIKQDTAAEVEVINRPSVDVPLDKTWFSTEDSTTPLDSSYTWTATFVLEEREVHVDGPISPDANTHIWRTVHDIAPITITESTGLDDRTFDNLPMYRYYPNGAVYRILYSVDEVSYELKQNGTTISKWDKDNGLTVGDVQYAPHWPHDAGDTDDEMHMSEDDPLFYHIIVENHKHEVTVIEKLTDLELHKLWEDGALEEAGVLERDAFATFQLKRYVRTEFVEYDQTEYDPDVDCTVTLIGQNGQLDQVTVKKGSRMKISATFAENSQGSIHFMINGDPNNNLELSRYGGDYTVSSSPFTVTGDMTISPQSSPYYTPPCSGTITGASVVPYSSQGVTLYEDTEFTNEQHYYTVDQAGNWTQTIDNLPLYAESGIISGASGISQQHFHYSYYFTEVDSNPRGFYAEFTDGSGNPLGDSSHRITENGTHVTGRNKKIPPFAVEKKWYSLEDPDNYPEIRFTLYQCRVSDNGTLAQGNIFTDENGKSYEHIPLNSDNNWHWDCPVYLPDSDDQGNRLGYYVMEDSSGNNSGHVLVYQNSIINDDGRVIEYGDLIDEGTGEKYDVKPLDYYNSVNSNHAMTQDQNFPDGRLGGFGGNEGTLYILNRVPKYMQMDIKKKILYVREDGSVATIMDEPTLQQNIVLEIQLKRRVIYEGILEGYDRVWNTELVDGNVVETTMQDAVYLTDWEDYGNAFMIGFDNEHQPISNNAAKNHFVLEKQGGFFWRIVLNTTEADQYGYAQNVGLPAYGYYTLPNGEEVPVRYRYIPFETGMYSDMNRTPYKEGYEWAVGLQPASWDAAGGEPYIFDPMLPNHDQDRIKNVQASDLYVEKDWTNTPDNVQEVYVKLYRTRGMDGEEYDVTNDLAERTDTFSQYGFVENPETLSMIGGGVLVIKQGSDPIHIHKLPLVYDDDNYNSKPYLYWIEEVGYKDSDGNVYLRESRNTDNPADGFFPEYDQSGADGAYQNDWQASPTARKLKLLSVGKNKLRVKNYPTRDIEVLKKWIDVDGTELTGPWNKPGPGNQPPVATSIKFKVKRTNDNKYLTFGGSQTLTILTNGQRAVVRPVKGPGSEGYTPGTTEYTVTYVDDEHDEADIGNWTTKVHGLEKYDPDGNEYTYTIEELKNQDGKPLNGDGQIIDNCNTTVDMSGNPYLIINEKVDTSLSIVKTFGGSVELTEEQKANITFRVTKQAGPGPAPGPDSYDQTFTYGVDRPEVGAKWTNGTLVIRDITPGHYTVVEEHDDSNTMFGPEVGPTIMHTRTYTVGTTVTTDSANAEVHHGERTTVYVNNIYDDVKPGIKIVKIDEESRGDAQQILLPGTEFTLYKNTGTTSVNYTVYPDADSCTKTTGSTEDDYGFVQYDELPDGQYKITENKTPKGYVKTENNDIYFDIVNGVLTRYTGPYTGAERTADEEIAQSANVVKVTYVREDIAQTQLYATFTVGNERGTGLPSTGGPGTGWLYLVGSLLAVLAAAGITVKWKRRGYSF